ncbi:hypothetical protein [Streptomyces sp. NPDC058954]|uniref:hypothetical protein n=1 Tax=Streptomyces sp. NPDC058954 TaxID=3346677 RepID=UPI003688ADE2
MGSMQPELSWPYESGGFPEGLLAIVQRTVSEAQFPALTVIHDEEDDWLVSDDVHDPNEDGASIVQHLHHVVALDPSIAELVTMPPGHVACRTSVTAPWEISEWVYGDDEGSGDSRSSRMSSGNGP